SERTFPARWLAPSKVDVTDDFVRYARPLIGEDWPTVPLVGGIQRFARIRRIMAPKRLPEYEPQAYRKS
ncbi:MAG: 6-phosphofructokinase, partial [Anaerolineae bacterium]